MAGFLENLSLGLRGAGGILDPGVFQQQNQEQSMMAQVAERRRDMIAQQIIKAAESGAMETEVAQQKLAQLGYGGMSVGPTEETKAKKVALENNVLFRRAAIEARGDEDKLADAAMTYGKPEIAERIYRSKQDRAAALERHRDSLDMRLQAIDIQSSDRNASLEQRDQASRRADETKRAIASVEAQIAMLRLDRRGEGGSKEPKAIYDSTSSTGFIWDAPGRESLHGKPAPPPAGFTRLQNFQGTVEAQMGAALENITKLEKLVTDNPRSVATMFAPVKRGIEGLADVVKPGLVASPANEGERLIQSTIVNLPALFGTMGRMSNQDTVRLQTAIGKLKSGTAEVMQEGLASLKKLILERQTRTGAIPTFANEEQAKEARKAGRIKNGQRINVGGKLGDWEDD